MNSVREVLRHNTRITHSSYNNLMWNIETSFDINVASVVMPCRHRIEDILYDEFVWNNHEIS
jgi:hypothetical protein